VKVVSVPRIDWAVLLFLAGVLPHGCSRRQKTVKVVIILIKHVLMASLCTKTRNLHCLQAMSNSPIVEANSGGLCPTFYITFILESVNQIINQ